MFARAMVLRYEVVIILLFLYVIATRENVPLLVSVTFVCVEICIPCLCLELQRRRF